MKETGTFGWGHVAMRGALFLLVACGSGHYAIVSRSATARLEEARTVGAAEFAPYEFHYAEEHLRQAEVEAAEASYSDAARFAEIAETYAAKAVTMARARRAQHNGP